MAADAETTSVGQATAPALVSEYLAAHPEWTSDELEQKARNLAERAELTHPINRAPSTVAAAAVYLAGLLVNEKLTQQEVTAASGVSSPAIRECYIEMCDHEGLRHPRHDRSDPRATQRSGGLVNRVRTWVSRCD